jgi:hypothetical protein
MKYMYLVCLTVKHQKKSAVMYKPGFHNQKGRPVPIDGVEETLAMNSPGHQDRLQTP